MNDVVKILIVGNGFGGVYTLKNLYKACQKNGRKVEISMVGERDYFLFTPLLHEVATGGIRPDNIIEPIRDVLGPGCNNLYIGKAEKINLKNKNVEIRDRGGDLKPVSYDYLVLAPGAETNFYNIRNAEEFTLPLKTLDDAIKIKNRCITELMRASEEKDPEKRKALLTFVVAGGGATGVELAAELHEFLKGTFLNYYPKELIEQVQIILIQKGPDLIPQFGPKLRRKSLRVLQKLGVKVMLNTGVKEINAENIILDCKTDIKTENLFWVAGIKPVKLEFDQNLEKSEDGRIIVDETLAIPGYQNVFILGDAAAIKIKNKNNNQDTYVAALAQAAVKEAEVVAKNIKLLIDGKNPEKFIYHHSGTLISLGHGQALGEIRGFAFSGRITWWLWRTVYLSKLISWRKKTKIAIEWTLALFRPRDISPL